MRVIVAGASNQIGFFLLPRLVEAGHEVIALSRFARQDESDQINWLQVDLSQQDIATPDADAWIHAGPLPLLPRVLERLPAKHSLRRVIAFSSTSRLSKINSPDTSEVNVAQTLAAGETELSNICATRDIDWTIFRPTLVYGCSRDENVTFIARFIQRYGFFPTVNQGTGLRQPVHADDLAIACVQTLENTTTFQKIYELSGGETLSYRAMVETIFRALNRRPFILTIPLWLFGLTLRVARILPAWRHLSPAMLSRTQVDLTFSHEAATKDFDYQPQKFHPVFAESDVDFGVNILKTSNEKYCNNKPEHRD